MAFNYDDICTALAGLVATPEVDYKVGDKEYTQLTKPINLKQVVEFEQVIAVK